MIVSRPSSGSPVSLRKALPSFPPGNGSLAPASWGGSVSGGVLYTVTMLAPGSVTPVIWMRVPSVRLTRLEPPLLLTCTCDGL